VGSKPGEYFLVGGFHRLTAIRDSGGGTRATLIELMSEWWTASSMKCAALNLKLNADRLDAKPSDYFDAVIYLSNANWDKQKVAAIFRQERVGLKILSAMCPAWMHAFARGSMKGKSPGAGRGILPHGAGRGSPAMKKRSSKGDRRMTVSPGPSRPSGGR